MPNLLVLCDCVVHLILRRYSWRCCTQRVPFPVGAAVCAAAKLIGRTWTSRYLQELSDRGRGCQLLLDKGSSACFWLFVYTPVVLTSFLAEILHHLISNHRCMLPAKLFWLDLNTWDPLNEWSTAPDLTWWHDMVTCLWASKLARTSVNKLPISRLNDGCVNGGATWPNKVSCVNVPQDF